MIARVLSIRGLWVLLTITAAFIGPASSPIGIPDIFWTLLRGEWMASHGQLLDGDPFTSAPHTSGPILNPQWFADLSFHGLYALGGLEMVVAGTAVVIATTYALLLVAAVTASGRLRLSCLAVWIGYAIGLSNLSPRPQTLAYPLFALFLLAVVRAEWRKDNRLLWLLPPAMVLWANLHGSFLTGCALLGCAALGHAIATRSIHSTRPYLLTLAACLVACLINPYGLGLLLYVANIGSNQVIRDLVTEWSPTTVNSVEGSLFFGSLLLLAVLLFKARLRPTPVELLVLLVFGYLALTSVRAVVWWALAITPTVARLLGSISPARQSVSRDLPAVNALLMAGVLALATLSLPWMKSALPILPAGKRGLLADTVPVGVGDYLRTHDPPSSGGMFNIERWGGYLEWATWPRHQIFVDGRFELHPTQVWFDYLDVVFPNARWRALLDQYGIAYVVLDTAESADLIATMRADAAWREDYTDDQAVLFSRVSPSAGT